MTCEVITVPAGQQSPRYWDASLFIDGSSTDPSLPVMSWRSDVIAMLRDQWRHPGRLVVFVPEHSEQASDATTEEPGDWYDYALGIADVAMFWWPDDIDPRLPRATVAACDDSQRAVHGAPLHAPHAKHLLRYASGRGISTATTLSEMISTVLGMIAGGARRAGGEREVPLPVWRSESFQRWYSAQTSAGNTLVSARQVWTLGTGPRQKSLTYWALHVHMYVSSEARVKSNEVVLSRPDISVMALCQRKASLDDSIVVLVREFRSPASTPDGFIHELPGGSGDTGVDAQEQAVAETQEETGLAIDVRRIRRLGSRQLVGTMSAHHANLFTAEITDGEISQLYAAQARPQGTGGTERTWVEVTTFADIRKNRLVDWATLGMIAEALLDSGTPHE